VKKLQSVKATSYSLSLSLSLSHAININIILKAVYKPTGENEMITEKRKQRQGQGLLRHDSASPSVLDCLLDLNPSGTGAFSIL